jgi:hypothetical protein
MRKHISLADISEEFWLSRYNLRGDPSRWERLSSCDSMPLLDTAAYANIDFHRAVPPSFTLSLAQIDHNSQRAKLL